MAKTRFVQKFLALVTGDKNEQLALYNATKAESAIELQLANLKADIVQKKADVAEAEEAYEATIFPTEKINSGSVYIQNIADAKENVDAAKESLEEALESEKFYKNMLAQITEKVD